MYNRRKSLTINAAIKLIKIFENNKISILTKTSAFKTYIYSIFLYNSETWSTTKQLNAQIDSFQRRLIRKFILNVKWPDVVKNEQVYSITKLKPWSETIKLRRIKWCVINTPVRHALTYALSPYIRSRGRPQTTWVSMTKDELKKMDITWDLAFKLAQDEKKWEQFFTNFFVQ